MASQFLAPISRSTQAPALPSVFSTFRSLQQGMDSMLANMLRGAGQGDGSGIAQLLSAPRMDVEETEDEYCVTAELPGLSDQDVEVTVEDNLLVISGEKREEHEREAGNRRIVEREFGRFRRALQPYSQGRRWTHTRAPHRSAPPEPGFRSAAGPGFRRADGRRAGCRFAAIG